MVVQSVDICSGSTFVDGELGRNEVSRLAYHEVRQMHYNPEDGSPMGLLLNIGAANIGAANSNNFLPKRSNSLDSSVPVTDKDLHSLCFKNGIEYCRLDDSPSVRRSKAADWKCKEVVEKIEENTETYLEKNGDRLDGIANMLVELRRERMKKRIQVCKAIRLVLSSSSNIPRNRSNETSHV